MVAKGEFREDLLYRINTIHLEIPSLRERPEDIIPLAELFIARFCKQYDKPPVKLTDGACEKLTLHPWYGNIRELEHAIEKPLSSVTTKPFRRTVPAGTANRHSRSSRIHARRNGNADDTEDARQM